MADRKIVEPISGQAVAKTIVASNAPNTAGAATFGRDLAILIAGGTAVAGFASKGDLIGFAAWVQSVEALPFIALVGVIATSAYRFVKARTDAKEKAALAATSPIGALK